MAVMQDWIVRCEQKLARAATVVAACVCFVPSAHAFSLDETQSVSLWELIIAICVVAAFFTSVLSLIHI